MTSPHWDWKKRSIADIVWPSFLAATVASLMFFSAIDPNLLLDLLGLADSVEVMSIYSILFFFFWITCALSSTITTWLIRTERKRSEFPGEQT